MATLTLKWTTHPPSEFTGGAIAVGNFDGVHRGHRELISAAKRWAVRLGGPTVAVTFDPPPAALLYPRPDKAVPITSLADRADLLHAAGADHVVTLHSEPGLLALSPEAFFEDVILGLFRAKAMAEGSNFRFGRGRAGDTGTLRELCGKAGVAFEEVPPVLFEGEPISSSRVRVALVAGDVEIAAELLGRSHHIAGVVENGARRGRTIGFPTANLGEVATLVPAVGVYAVRAGLPDGMTHPAAANIGPNPTFGEDVRKIEIHVIGYAGDLYGKTMRVEFVRRLRDTRPFRSPDELVEQLRRDVDAAQSALEGSK